MKKRTVRSMNDRTRTPSVKTEVVQQRGNRLLFYCIHCSRSLWLQGTEDQDIRKKYGYSVWYATCPVCGEQIRQTDHYRR